MNKEDKIAVCSRSFSQDNYLKEVLKKNYKFIKFNDEGLSLKDESLIKFLKGQNKAILGLEKIDRDILSKLPDLKVISKYGVGIDNLDLQAMKDFGVRLGRTEGVNKRSVSELVICFALSMLRMIPKANNEVRQGIWNQFKGNQLTGKTFGIIGFGNIGRDLIKLLKPFKCRVLVYDIFKIESGILDDAVQTNLDKLLKSSDIVSLHLPYNDSTERMFDENKFKLMRSTAILINLSRGGIVVEEELKQALIDGEISAAAFDVFLHEPPSDQELLNLPNFLATPHIGGIATEAIQAMGMAAIEGLEKNKLAN